MPRSLFLSVRYVGTSLAILTLFSIYFCICPDLKTIIYPMFRKPGLFLRFLFTLRNVIHDLLTYISSADDLTTDS